MLLPKALTFIWKIFQGIWQKAFVQAWHTVPLQNVSQRLTSPKGSNTLQLNLAPAPSALSHAMVRLSRALPNTSRLRTSCSFSLKLGMAFAYVGCDLHLSSLWLLHNKHAAPLPSNFSRCCTMVCCHTGCSVASQCQTSAMAWYCSCMH